MAVDQHIPWRDFDPWKRVGADGITQYLQDMRFVHSGGRKAELEPPDVTERLKPYRKWRDEDSSGFIKEMLKLEDVFQEKQKAEIDKIQEREEQTGVAEKHDESHCILLCEQLIADIVARETKKE